MSPRQAVRGARRWASVGSLVVAAACANANDRAEVTAFCVQFPQRDAGVALRLPSDPQLGGDPATVKAMMQFSADGPERHAPVAIKDQVARYVRALREYQPGHDPMSDPALASAVQDINAWLVDHCPPPASPATTR